jgi:hypothetical protein
MAPAARKRPALLRALLQSNRHERLAALAAIVTLGAFALPWYRAPFELDLTKSGLEAFGFGGAALLLTAGAALILISRAATDRRPPLPMHEGTLLILAGIWSAVIVGTLMVDRPHLEVRGFETDYGLASGLFVELGAAGVLAIAGSRLRKRELSREAQAARTPSAPSPPRSRQSPS